MDGCDLLETYKFLVGQQELADDIDEEEQLLNELDKLWYAMSKEQRQEADAFVTSLLN